MIRKAMDHRIPSNKSQNTGGKEGGEKDLKHEKNLVPTNLI